MFLCSLAINRVGPVLQIRTSVEQRQSSNRLLCREQLRIGIMKISKLYTARPAPRRVLISSLDRIVSE